MPIKPLAVLYSSILVVFGSGIIFLSLGSPHHLDTSLVVSNWVTVISFPVTIYLLNKYFYNKKYLNIIVFSLAVNCIVFFNCCYDIIKTNNDGFDDIVISLAIPLLGLLLSLFFKIKFIVKAIKAEKC